MSTDSVSMQGRGNPVLGAAEVTPQELLAFLDGRRSAPARIVREGFANLLRSIRATVTDPSERCLALNWVESARDLWQHGPGNRAAAYQVEAVLERFHLRGG